MILGYCIKKGSASSQTSAEILQLYKVGLFERSRGEACHFHHKNTLPANRLEPLCCCCCTELEISGSPLGVLVRRQKKQHQSRCPRRDLETTPRSPCRSKMKKQERVNQQAPGPSALLVRQQPALQAVQLQCILASSHLSTLYILLVFTVSLRITLTAETWVPSCCCSLETFH